MPLEENPSENGKMQLVEMREALRQALDDTRFPRFCDGGRGRTL